MSDLSDDLVKACKLVDLYRKHASDLANALERNGDCDYLYDHGGDGTHDICCLKCSALTAYREVVKGE